MSKRQTGHLGEKEAWREAMVRAWRAMEAWGCQRGCENSERGVRFNCLFVVWSCSL